MSILKYRHSRETVCFYSSTYQIDFFQAVYYNETTLVVV